MHVIATLPWVFLGYLMGACYHGIAAGFSGAKQDVARLYK